MVRSFRTSRRPRAAIACALVASSLAAGCTSTRLLAAPGDARLRAAGHVDGYVVHTTTPWRERVDPLTELRFQRGDGAWSPRVTAMNLFVDGEGVWNAGGETRSGWPWRDVAKVEVENVSGGKTLGAIIGYSALTIALLPLGLLMRGGSIGSLSGPVHASGGGGGGGGGLALVGGGGGSGSGEPPPAELWSPEGASDAARPAHRMFTLGSRIRAIAAPMLSLDGAVGIRGDLISTGVLARIRFGQVFEIGGGVRSLETHGVQSTAGVFQVGLHLPLDAGMRLAIPLGLEVGGGGEVERDLRLPWGLRYTSRSGRWFATASPATPSYLHVVGEPRRWSLVSGTELGVRF